MCTDVGEAFRNIPEVFGVLWQALSCGSLVLGRARHRGRTRHRGRALTGHTSWMG